MCVVVSTPPTQGYETGEYSLGLGRSLQNIRSRSRRAVCAQTKRVPTQKSQLPDIFSRSLAFSPSISLTLSLSLFLSLSLSLDKSRHHLYSQPCSNKCIPFFPPIPSFQRCFNAFFSLFYLSLARLLSLSHQLCRHTRLHGAGNMRAQGVRTGRRFLLARSHAVPSAAGQETISGMWVVYV